jgi:hypothetical protein
MRISFKKILVIAFLIPFFSVSAFALSENTTLTFGDVMTLYFTELFPVSHKEVDDVVVKYSGISSRYSLYTALKKGIYYGIIPNISAELHPDTPMTDGAFAKLLQKDF